MRYHSGIPPYYRYVNTKDLEYLEVLKYLNILSRYHIAPATSGMASQLLSVMYHRISISPQNKPPMPRTKMTPPTSHRTREKVLQSRRTKTSHQQATKPF